MTKKDYILIADSLASSFKDLDEKGGDFYISLEAQNHISNNLALALKTDNPLFDDNKWNKAVYQYEGDYRR